MSRKVERAAIYARVSTDTQTVENQIRELRRFAERPDKGVLTPPTTDDQNFHPSFAPVACVIRVAVLRLASLGMKSNGGAYFTATEMASASERLRRASLAELPMRT